MSMVDSKRHKVSADRNQEDWEHMFSFAQQILDGERGRYRHNIFAQRLSIIHIDCAIEIMMKAYMLKNGYLINIIKNRPELRQDTLVSEIINNDRTIDFQDALNVVSRELSLDSAVKTKIMKFHKLRNEIQHRSLDLDLNKQEAIVNFIPSLKTLVQSLFPKYSTLFDDLDEIE